MNRPIGIFDSGVGGLSVLREIRAQLPSESLIYFGDTARVPYGDKSPQTIIQYSLEIAKFLFEKDIKALVVACNTSSVHAMEALEKISPVPVIDVLRPTVDYAIQVTKGKIGVIGTKSTIKSNRYALEIQSRDPSIEVISSPCPLFVPLVEADFLDHLATKLIVKEYLKPLVEAKVDTLILGCTHYPFLKDLIRMEMGEDVRLCDSGEGCAAALQSLFPNTRETEAHVQYFVSDDPESFSNFASKWVKPIGDKVSLPC
ncbi:MAG: glutamate racemase [Waddliaceae bacterium]